MGYLNEDRVRELWEKIKNTFARKEDIPALPDLAEPLAQTLAEAKTYADATYRQSTGYTDQKVADLIGGAPETLDTLAKVEDAIAKHDSVVTALDAAIGKKADAAEVDAHTGNNTIHMTASEKNKLAGIEAGAQVNTVSRTDLSKVNPVDAFYDTGVGGNIDTHISDIEFICQHPYIFGHSTALSTLGYWLNVSSIKNSRYNQVSQIAVSENGMASRYYSHSTNVWSDWHFFATKNDINTLKQSFQVGCDTIYNKCVSCGATPSAKTPAAIAAAIQLIQSNAVSAGKSSIKISTYTVNAKLTLNTNFKILISDMPNNTKRVIGYFIVGDGIESTSGAAALSTTMPFNLIDGATESFIMLYMHPSNGTKIWHNSMPVSVTREQIEVKGLGTRIEKRVASPIFVAVTLFDANGNWDAYSTHEIYIKGTWKSLTTTKDRKVTIIYETE